MHFINRGCRWRYSMRKQSLFWDAIDEGSSKLQGGPPLSLFDMLLTTREGLRTYVSFVVHLPRWFFCLLGCGSFHFVPRIPPFWGALVYWPLAGFHHFSPFFGSKVRQISHKGIIQELLRSRTMWSRQLIMQQFLEVWDSVNWIYIIVEQTSLSLCQSLEPIITNTTRCTWNPGIWRNCRRKMVLLFKRMRR